MKKFLLTLLLLVAIPLMAEETNVIKIIITINLTQPTPQVIVEPTNSPVSVVVTNSFTDKQKLIMEINRMTEKIYDITNGYPDRFTDNSNDNTQFMINRLKDIWETNYPIAISNLNLKKLELKKLK